MMYRFSLVRVKDPEAADELVQATFFAALKSQHIFCRKIIGKNLVVWHS
jgi:DNA-directed RNA polymerase specialized sigma24 family protein